MVDKNEEAVFVLGKGEADFLGVVANLEQIFVGINFFHEKYKLVQSFSDGCILPLVFDVLDDGTMVADENILEQSPLLLPSHCLPVLPQFYLSFLFELTSGIPSNKFSDPLVKSFLLLFVDNSTHFVSFIVVEFYIFEVESVLGLVVI